MKKIYNDSRSYIGALFIMLIAFGFMPNQIKADVVGTDPFNPTINVFADGTWATISSNTLTLAGFTILGANAVTWNSDDLLFYAILRVSVGGRRLVTVDPSTGVCSDIGDMGGNFSSLSYSSTTGTMYAMGGAGAGSFARRLYSVNLSTGTPTFLAGPFTLIAGDGEVIAYNYDDGLMYHWSGITGLSSARMSTINLTTFVETEIIQSGATHSEIFGAVYQGAGRFIATDISSSSFTITSTGLVTAGPTGLPFDVRGLGYVDALLPVELSSFTSAVSGNDVTLNWTTASETNNSGFDIERSSVSGTWSKIGNVSGNGTTSSSQNYTYTDNNVVSGNYSYRLKQIDFNGNFEYFNLSSEVNVGIPNKFDLAQNYPNPFNPSTNISYDIPTDGKVSLMIYDMSGKEVMSLVNEVKTAGYYSVSFNAANLSSGIYFYTLNAGDFSATKKMMLVK